MKTIEEALKWLQEEHNAEFATHYGEPGYQDSEKGILLANWNNVPSNMQKWLEKNGYELEWCDEWTIDYNNDKAYRTAPDSYSWEPQWVMGEGEYLFPDDGAGAIIEACCMTDWNQPARCVPSWITVDDLLAEGYELFKPGLESGWFPGQDDDPAKIAKEAFVHEDAERVVFRKTENSQFYCRFECWFLKSEETEDA